MVEENEMKKFGLILILIFLLSISGSAKTLTIGTIADANQSGVVVGLQSGTTSDLYAQVNLNESEVIGYQTILLAEAALEIGDVNLLLGDKPVLDVFVAEATDYAVLDTFSEELFGLAVAEGETDMLAAINAALDEIFEDDGAHGYDAIYSEWFDDLPAVYDDTTTDFSYPAKPASGVMADVLTDLTIRFGTDPTYPPFENLNDDDEYEGFDIDMMYEIALRFSTHYDLTIEVEVVESAWEPIIPNLNLGEFDVLISAMTKTPEREEVVDFSRAYYGSIQAMVGLVGGEIESIPLPIIPVFLSLLALGIVVRRRR